MTDFTLPDDELLSSYLDGELTAEEVARLDARLKTDVDLTIRLDALRAAAAVTATPVAPLDADAAEGVILAALEASTTAENVTDLAAVAQRRSAWRMRVATVAAGVVALAIAVPALRSIDSDGDNSDDAGSTDAFETVADEETDTAGDSEDVAGDLSMEAAPATADADMAAAEAGIADDAGGDADAAFADDAGVFTGPLQTPTAFAYSSQFDPVVDELGEFESAGELTEALRERWTAYRAASLTTTTTDTSTPTTSTPTTSNDLDPTDDSARGEEVTQAAERLDDIGLGACPDAIEVIDTFDFGAEVVAADYAGVIVAGERSAVGFFALADDTASVLVFDTISCELRSIPLD